MHALLVHWLLLVLPHVGRKTSSMLEVDDEGGRMFLRVLLHLTMHDYPPLVSGALQLLFKHFSQRQEAMHTFKQVRGATARPWACMEPWVPRGSSCSQFDRDVGSHLRVHCWGWGSSFGLTYFLPCGWCLRVVSYAQPLRAIPYQVCLAGVPHWACWPFH